MWPGFVGICADLFVDPQRGMLVEDIPSHIRVLQISDLGMVMLYYLCQISPVYFHKLQYITIITVVVDPRRKDLEHQMSLLAACC